MDNSGVFDAQLGWKNTVPVSLMMVTLLCAVIISAVAAAVGGSICNCTRRGGLIR